MIPATLAILMIRPLRCFSIGRSTAWMKLNAPFKFVSTTTSQSASLIRIESPSRVSPALFTRMSTREKSASTRSASAFTALVSATSTA